MCTLQHHEYSYSQEEGSTTMSKPAATNELPVRC